MPPRETDRSALLATKLRLLVTERWGAPAAAVAGSFPSGATLLDTEAGRGWVLVEDDAERRLGGALAVAVRAGVDELHLVVEDPEAAAILARRASTFARPP